jgi:GT2 family glycosyltransferase
MRPDAARESVRTLGVELHSLAWELAVVARAFVSRRKRIAAFAEFILRRFPKTRDALVALAKSDSTKRYQTWVARYDTLEESEAVAARSASTDAREPALLSIIVCLGEADIETIEELVTWLQRQFYARWEAILVVEPTASADVRTFLAGIPARDARFALRGEVDVPLADILNAALENANGEHAVVLDSSALPRQHALLLVAREIAEVPAVALIYADEDSIDEMGTRSDHYFKPDWSEALLCSRNYLGGLVAFSRQHALEAGGFYDELDDEYVWGLALRVANRAGRDGVRHLPFVLTHRSAAGALKRTRTREHAAHAHESRLARVGKHARVEPVGDASFRIHYELPQPAPRVTVVMPSACRLEYLQPCLESVLHRTSYTEVEVLLVVNEIRKQVPQQQEYLDVVAREPRVRVLVYEDRPFNLAWVSNWAVRSAQGELLCFLNDDTDVIDRDWLSVMVAHAFQDRVAAVGALLVYPNDRIQHAGVILGVGGIAGHADVGAMRQSRGYHERLLVDQDVSCVTGACMVVWRDVFEVLGGFDESLPGAFNDVDFCLRLRKAGWRIVWTPNAQLYHRESVSIGRHYSRERGSEWTAEATLMTTRWRDALGRDPYYSPNLSLDQLQLWEPAFPPRVSYPWR